MRLPRRTFLEFAAGAAALPLTPRAAFAQAAYPVKPITMIVPYAAGGPTDTIARIMAERLRVSLGQAVIIENTTGAGGTIAVAAVCNGRMGCEPHSARAGILQQTGNLLAAKPDCFQRCVKFAPQMKKNRAIAAPACAPLGMDAFTRAQYEWGCGLPRRSHSPRP